MELENHISKLCQLKKQASDIKQQIAEEEAYFLKLAETAVADSKTKSIAYSNDYGDKVTVTNAQEVKVLYPTFLKKVFGDCFDDVIKEETKYNISAYTKRILCGISLDEYVKLTVSEVLKEITHDETIISLLKKKCKGVNFEKDKINLMNIAGLSEKDASEYAYFIAEATVWEGFLNMMQIIDNSDIENGIKYIKNAVITEEKPKITVEAV